MNIKFDRAGLNLEKDGILRLQGAAGTCLQCRSGALWITQDHDANDYVLGPGDTLELEHGGDAIVFALLQSELVLREPLPQESALARLGHGLVAAARAWGSSIAKWVTRRFGPEGITDRRMRGWHGAM